MSNRKSEIFKSILDTLGIAVSSSIPIGLDIINDHVTGHLQAGLYGLGGLYAFYNSYKYKRFEENIKTAISDLYEKMDRIESHLSDEIRGDFTERLLPTFWDHVIEEPESEKVQLFVNCVVASLKEKEINMDKIFVYFEILKQLRLNEINYFLDVIINNSAFAVQNLV